MAMRRPRDPDDSEEDVPFHYKKPFGAGIKRKKVEFVPAQDIDESAAAASARRDKASAIGDLYASVVLAGSSSTSSAKSTGVTTPAGKEADICPVCTLPITGTATDHNASLAHQVSLEHSYPPSALDRSRMGLKALQAQGWDPDARRGLGMEGEGMRYPIKVAAKDDTLGIGAVIPEVVKDAKSEEPKKLSGKEMKIQLKKDKEKAERLQREIYGRVDVEAYLRGDRGVGLR